MPLSEVGFLVSIANFAVSRRVTVAMMATAIVVLGVFALPRLPIDLLPSFQPPIVSVTVNYGNVAPDIMESTITRPIEQAVGRVSGIDYMQSDSYQGQTVVRAVFKYGVDINVAEVDIQQQISRIQSQLPTDPNLQAPQIVKQDPNALPVVGVFISDPTRTQRDLNDLYTNYLTDEFASIPGVASASTQGGPTRALTVEPDQIKIAGSGITNAQIVSRLANENVDDPSGILAIGPKEYGIRTSALFKSADEVGGSVVAIKNGAPIYLRDIAKVNDAIEEQRVFARLSGIPAIRLNVNAQPDANVVAVADGVYKKIDDLEKRYPAMSFTVVFDQRSFIQEAITALEHTALLGSVLAVFIILIFLHSWRSTLIVSVSLPVSVLGTFFAAYLLHQTLNTMTLGGLALAVGLIVDDAVVVIENIFRHLDEGESPLDAARNATRQILSAVLSSTITVVTVFVPLLLIPGLQGLIFGPFALTVMIGVAISFVVAVTTVPMLSSLLLRGEDNARKPAAARAFDRAYERFERAYRSALAWSIDRPVLVLGAGALAFFAAIAALKAGVVATEQFPASDSRYVRFNIRTPNGTSLAETDRITKQIEHAMSKDPRVIALGTLVGSTYNNGGLLSITNQSTIAATLREGVEGVKARAFINEWQARLGGAPRPGSRPGGTTPTATATAAPFSSPYYANMNDDERQRARDEIRRLRKTLVGTAVFGRTIDVLQQQITQGADALQIQLYGPDYTELYRLAQGAIPALSQIRGVTRPDTNVTASQPEVDVKIDRRKAAQYGFSTGDIATDIATATSGTIASYYQINGVQYPILVEAPPAQRRSFDSLATMQLTPPATGGLNPQSTTGSATAPSSQSFGSVPLSAIAAIVPGIGPSQISRQNKQRRIDINAPVIGRPLGEVVQEARDIMNAYKLPSGYRWQFGPAITDNDNQFTALALVVALAIALIYMLLASQFESFLDPLVIMVSVPFALIGIVGSLALTQRAFGLTAFIGSLMLVGIAVKNAILVVEFTKQLRRDGMDAREALLHAGPRRLRPILMTTLATIGGMLPLALGIEAGSATQAPLGTVVIGGLLTSTLLSLIVVPTVYLLVARHVEPRVTGQPPKLTLPPTGVGTREKAGVYK